MTTVLAGGDSFVWGSELADSPHGGLDGYSRNTFPALLSDGPYTCVGYPGLGNRDIAQRVEDCLTWMQPNEIFVLVCWTWPTRDSDFNSDRHINILEEYLRYHKYRYMFTCADNCVLTKNIDLTRWYLFPGGTAPQDTQDPRGFYQWAVENKYKCGPENHPLEQAHRDAADLMQGKFNELVNAPVC
jgi:hypothetical protein